MANTTRRPGAKMGPASKANAKRNPRRQVGNRLTKNVVRTQKNLLNTYVPTSSQKMIAGAAKKQVTSKARKKAGVRLENMKELNPYNRARARAHTQGMTAGAMPTMAGTGNSTARALGHTGSTTKPKAPTARKAPRSTPTARKARSKGNTKGIERELAKTLSGGSKPKARTTKSTTAKPAPKRKRTTKALPPIQLRGKSMGVAGRTGGIKLRGKSMGAKGRAASVRKPARTVARKRRARTYGYNS